MKVKLIAMLIGVVIVYTASCKKGDMGPEGQKGVQGETGVQGVKGDNGSTIFSGEAIPAASLGKVGDFYFRTTTGDLYGPKVAAGWGAAVRLKGTNGTNGSNGAAGSKILSGTTVPAVGVGAVGDFYFQTNTSLFFGPKTAAGWGVGVSLKGATGATGATGTANVIYSGWQLAKVFKDSIIDGTKTMVGHIHAPKVTTDVLNRGTVLVYLNFGGGVFTLPYASFAAQRASTIGYLLKPSEIVVYRFAHDGGIPVNLSTALSYRYIIIPGGVAAVAALRNVDLNDYRKVEQILNANK